MRPSPRILSDSSGQALLITVVFITLILIAFTVGFFVTQTGLSHQTASTLRVKGRAVAIEGIAYAANELSASSATWKSARNGDFSGTDCNGTDIGTPAGGRFKLTCSADPSINPELQSYQVAVTVVALDRSKNPIRAVKAYLSQRTLGVDLATGYHGAAALQLVNQPPTPPLATPWVGNLNVDWGPVVCLDATNANSWVLNGLIDTALHPRKFSVGGITGTIGRSGNAYNPAAMTDGKEYWAYVSQTFPPIISDRVYQALASSSSITTLATRLSDGSTIPANSACTPGVQCGYIIPQQGESADSAVFDGPIPGTSYTVPQGAVVYVIGSAQFKNIAIDGATFVITGDLTIDGSAGGGTGGAVLDLHVPVTAPSEYPYAATWPWPCKGKEGDPKTGGPPAYDCRSDNVFTSPGGNVHFRGFLYVKGNLIVKNSATFNMVGSVLVGDMLAPSGLNGRLEIEGGSNLNIAYDDGINHDIITSAVAGTSAGTTAIKLVPDLMMDVPIP